MRLGSVAASLLVLGCTGTITSPDLNARGAAPGGGGSVNPTSVTEPGPSQAPGFAQAGLRRLTVAQYNNSVRDLLGADVTLPSDLDPDDRTDGFSSIGSYRVTSSSDAVDRYSRAAFDLAAQVFQDPKKRLALVGCAPANATDPCSATFTKDFSRRAFRRPATTDELAALSDVAQKATVAYSEPWRGLEYLVAALLQDPNFLYMPLLGEPSSERPEALRYTSLEMATRLSYTLQGTTPDSVLLDAAERGVLLTPAGIEAQATRLLEAPAARAAVAQFFAEHLGYTELEQASKDATLYPDFNVALASSMRRELDEVLVGMAFAPNQNFMEVFTTKKHYVDAGLAKLYGLPGPSAGFVDATAAPDSQRAGLLTLAGILTNRAFATRTSPTLRGVFIRERILCQEVPPPPAGVDVTLSEVASSGAAPQTTRERLAAHRKNPICAACHAFFDPIGLALEHFDAIGGYRETESGFTLDTSGDLDGQIFGGARELSAMIAIDDRARSCLVRSLYQSAAGVSNTDRVQHELQTLDASFLSQGKSLSALLVELVKSPLFRFAERPL